MHDFARMEADFFDLESGVPRLNGMRDAIAEADNAGDLYWRFRFRFAYLKESIFCGDRYFAMIMFPELLALYDANEALQTDSTIAYQMLVAFKWIVEAAPEFPQISKGEIDSYFRLFKRRLLEQGCSLSIYYMKRSLFYMHCNPAIAAADFYRYLEAPLDEISDGRALYHDQQVIYYLSIGEEEKALRAAQPIFSGALTSNALPQSTYHEFIKFYMKRGNYAEAAGYAEKTERPVNRDAYYLDIIGSLMTLWGILDPARGLGLFKANYPVYLASRNPSLRMQFAIGAYQLFAALPQAYPVPQSFSVPADSPLYEDARKGNWGAMAAHFYSAGEELASKFDARNGTGDFMQLLQHAYPPKQEV